MGGVASSSKSNDDLIDNLLKADYIKTSMIERVFRAVDRAEYFLAEARTNAYKDIAWKAGNLHLSAPCIYSEVMEALCLKPGLSFLNLGSGTGYLSTMVGLILGSFGVNHGIEYYTDVVQYANKKLEEFKKHSGAMDEFDYCEPKFIQGNCLCLTSDCQARYDRVYCSAACPEQYESYMKNLLKIGGILVMPLNDQLLQIKRKSQTNWATRILLPVSFASIILPSEGSQEFVPLIEVEPLPLQALCRSVIRNILRKNVELEHLPPKRQQRNKRVELNRLVVVESDEVSDDDRVVRIGGYCVRARTCNGNSTRNGNNEDSDAEPHVDKMETVVPGSTESTEEKDKASYTLETTAIIEHNPSTSENGGNAMHTEGNGNKNTSADRAQSPHCRDSPNRLDSEDTSLDSINEIHSVFVDVLNALRGERLRRGDHLLDDDDDESGDEHTGNGDHGKRGATGTEIKKKKKRVRVLGGATQGESAEGERERKFEAISTSDSDSDSHQEKRKKRSSKSEDTPRSRLLSSARVVTQLVRYSSSDNENEEDEPPPDPNERRMYISPYTEHMQKKIQELPLPPVLKRYLIFYREL